jgi:hypothetical protein
MHHGIRQERGIPSTRTPHLVRDHGKIREPCPLVYGKEDFVLCPTVQALPNLLGGVTHHRHQK